MAQIKWTDTALDNINEIAEYISLDSVFYAEQFVHKLISVSKKIENHPEIGRIIPELPMSGYREILYKKYRIIYRISNEDIYIVSIHHSSRLLSNNEFFEGLFE